jgi:polyhydroxybutyrate depolymerase
MRGIAVAVAVCIAVAAALTTGTGAAGRTLAAVAERPAKASAGCKASPVAPGEQQVDTTSGSTPRTYLRRVPPAYTGTKPVPVLIDLHGYLEGARVHATNSMLGPFGDQRGFVTITPQGSGEVAAGWEVEPGSPDVRFVGDLLEEIRRTLCIDERRVYVAGYSNGAFLASTIACVYADRIAAIATVEGLMNPPGCNPSRPVPIVAFQGTGDEFVAYTGGLGPRAQTASANDGTGRSLGETSGGKAVARSASTPKVTAAWAKRNKCEAKPQETQVAPDVTRIHYRCPNRADVALYRIEGGGHTWPGSEFSRAIESAVGPTTFSINADEVMWAFFEAHPRPRA